MASKHKKHRAMGDEEWMSRLRKFAAVGVWPSEAGNRPALRQSKWHDMYLKVNLDKVMCVQSYNIKLCHIERGHIFMIHCQTILQIVKCLCLEGHRHVVVDSIQQRYQKSFPKIMKCWCCSLYY